MPRSKSSAPAHAREVGGIQLESAAELSRGLFFDESAPPAGEAAIELEWPNRPLIAFDDVDEVELPVEMPELDLKAYWIKAIQEMTDEEIAAFDQKARALTPKGIRPLPRKAPKLWKDAKSEDPSLDPPVFLQKYWGHWLDGISFHRGEFREYDPVGEKALQNWLHANRNEWPDGVYLPTKSEALDRRDVGSLKAARRVMMRVHRGKPSAV